MAKGFLNLTASHARPGLPVNYYVKIEGKKVWTGGFVTKAVKTGKHEITVTLRHWKTGAEFTNILRDGKAIWLHKATMADANPRLFANPLISAMTTLSITNGRGYFEAAEIGEELTQERPFPPGVEPETITF